MALRKAQKRKLWHPDLLREESSSNDSTSSTTFQDSNVQLCLTDAAIIELTPRKTRSKIERIARSLLTKHITRLI